jgi:UPF0755 protein
MSKSKSSCSKVAILILLFLLCIGGLLVVAGVVAAPRMAARVYGPPTSALSSGQKIALSLQLLTLDRANLLEPADPGGEMINFTIGFGEPVNLVALRLQDAGLVRSSESFRRYLVYSGLDTTLQAGDFRLSPRMPAVEIARALQDATPATVPFNILEGWRAEEIAAALPTSGLAVTPDAFLDLVQEAPEELLPQGWEGGRNLEGYLLPGSYQFNRQARPEDVVAALLKAFQDQVTDDLRAGFQAQGLSLSEAVTLASIVEREAVVKDEQAMIASVFYNRLAAGMRLESDPTVQFAIGWNAQQNTWWTNPLSASDLETDSPYNTYGNAGLPPGPISNPGLPALRAVAYPAQSPYYYFRAACDGSGLHNFAVTFEEHLGNACP